MEFINLQHLSKRSGLHKLQVEDAMRHHLHSTEQMPKQRNHFNDEKQRKVINQRAKQKSSCLVFLWKIDLSHMVVTSHANHVLLDKDWPPQIG